MEMRKAGAEKCGLTIVVTGAVFAVFIITRLWRLMDIPFGLHTDETSMAYSAWCLSQYGVDRHLNSMPVYLLNFGGGQSPLYPYLLAALFKIFDFHLALIRIPSLIFSLLTLIFGMGIVRLIYPDQRYAFLITGALVTISPYFIMAGRLGLDCNLMLGCSTVFLYCFLRAIGSGRKRWYAMAGVSGGIMLYSYALSYLMLPLFLMMALIYVIVVHKFSFWNWLIMAIPLGILSFPLVLEQIVNLYDLSPIRLGIFTITKMDSYRASEFERFSFESLRIALQDIFIGDMWLHNSIPGYLNLYWLSIPLAMFGLIGTIIKWISSFKRRELLQNVFVLFWFLAVLFVVCHIYPCINQVNSIFFTYAFFVTEGIVLTTGFCSKAVKRVVTSVIVFVYLLCFFRFGSYYFRGVYHRSLSASIF
ncbi:MAG: glycosyltransferase family 39 protein [Lachnospiraceae bacterium]|nr:glycosyltransferase family 39 protein [Lachnospiraceae bacterium]